MEAIRRKVLFSGQVQGVGFRYTAESLAGRFSVSGNVRNLANGCVELIAEGTATELDRFLAAIQETLESHITDKEITESPATGEFVSFSIAF